MVNSFAIGLLRKVLQQQNAYYCYKNSCFVSKTSWISLSTLLLCSALPQTTLTFNNRFMKLCKRDCNNKKKTKHFVIILIILYATCSLYLHAHVYNWACDYFFEIFFEPASIVNFKILSQTVNTKKSDKKC